MKSPIFSWLRVVCWRRPSWRHAAACLWAATASVSPDTKLDQVTVGIGGVFKVGRWTVLTVNLGLAISAAGAARSRCAGSRRLDRHIPKRACSIAPARAARRFGPVQDGPARRESQRSRPRRSGVVFSRQLRVSADPDADMAPPLRQTVFLIGHVRGSSPRSGRAGPTISPDPLERERERAGSECRLCPRGPTFEVVDIDSLDSLPAQADRIYVAGRDPARRAVRAEFRPEPGDQRLGPSGRTSRGVARQVGPHVRQKPAGRLDSDQSAGDVRGSPT